MCGTRAAQMLVRAGRMDMPAGTSGSEREMARCLDPETADRHHSQRPRSRQIPAGSATQTRNGCGTSCHRENARYPPTNGAYVETITFEPLGRLGKEGIQVVEAMAADASMMRGDRTNETCSGIRVADALTTAAGICGMQAWERGVTQGL